MVVFYSSIVGQPRVGISVLSPTHGCHLLMDHIVKYYHTVHVVFKLLTVW